MKIFVFTIILAAAAVMAITLAAKNRGAAPAHNQNNTGDLLAAINSGKSLMWIGPHPDDEVLASGTLAFAHDKGDSCYAFSVRNLNVLQNKVDPVKRGENIEWFKKHYLEDYIMIPGDVDNMTAEQIKQKVKQIIEGKKPDVILTFSPYGFYENQQHQSVSNGLLEIYEELSYRPQMYQIINMDDIIPGEHREYEKYPPTDAIDLNVYSDKLGKTYWQAKLETIEVYAQSVPLAAQVLTDRNRLEKSRKKDFFRRVK